MNRITTIAGRKIQHVARGHVIDVATGWEIEIESDGAAFSIHPHGAPGFFVTGGGRYTMKGLIERFAIAAALVGAWRAIRDWA